jgi:pimeloyl-ACP methyl ester carboxylesterase
MRCRQILGALVLLALSPAAFADDLPRHGIIGLTVATPEPNKPANAKTNPPTVQAVAPGSAGEAAGVRAGDVLLALDGAPVTSATEFAAAIGRHLAGQQVALALRRNGQEIALTAVLKPRPLETSAVADVIYDSVVVEGARRRVIVTRPRGPGRHPAVLLLGGLGCYSLDGVAQSGTYGMVLAALAKANYVTMRVEKTGEGDSQGPACTDEKATAALEAQGYVAGFAALQRYPFVDPEKIFLFAHSLGPLIGALALPQMKVRGVIAAETIGRSWFEYTLENIRRQSTLEGEPPDQLDAEVRASEKCAHDFFVLHQTGEAVTREAPACADMIQSYAGVPSIYMQQIGDLDLAQRWKQIDVPVLVIYGTADPVTSAEESRYLVGIINGFHPGRATYVELPGMGHNLRKYESQAEYLKTDGPAVTAHPFDEELNTVILHWLAQQLGPDSGADKGM